MESKRRRRRRRLPQSHPRTCETCEHCLPIGEGDHICDESYAGASAKLVLEEYIAGDDYFWCKGKKWEERG